MKERQSNLEILRLFSMFLIIGYHMITDGLFITEMGIEDYSIYYLGSRINQIITNILYPGGRIGVLLFFMITGFFLIEKKTSPFLKILVKTIVYCFLINSIFLILQFTVGIYPDGYYFSWKEYCLRNFLIPISSGTAWFATMYVALILVLPLFNHFLNSMSKKGYLSFLFFVDVFWFGFGHFFKTNYVYIYETILFYSMGGYVRKFIPNTDSVNKKWCILSIIILWAGCAYIAEKRIISVINCSSLQSRFYDFILKAVFVFPLGFHIFLFFNSVKINNRNWINTIASTTLAAYLIHGSVFQYYLWNKVFDIKNFYLSKYYSLFLLFSIIIVYLFSSAIDLLLEQIVFKKVITRIDNIITKRKEE